MNPVLKTLLLPSYYSFLRTGRRLGFFYKPQIKICIGSNKKYAPQTIPPLVASLLESGINGNDVHVFEGGYKSTDYTFQSYHHYLANHNSIDFTALIEAAESNVQTDYWFFLHDTCLAGRNFAKLVQNIPHFLPQTMPLKNYPSMNIGAYKADYLRQKKESLQVYRNESYDEKTLRLFKEKGVYAEDFLFRESHNPIVYNGWLLEPDETHRRDNIPIPAIYTNRVCEYFPQLDLYKFKANYRLQQRGILEL